MTKTQREALKKIVEGPSKIYFNESMKKHTSLKVGGLAECLIVVTDVEILKEILRYSDDNKIQTTIIGNGSNLLVLDGGIKGITIKIDIEKLEQKGQEIVVGAGNKLTQVAYTVADKGLSGMEEISGIPGTIGGAVCMNAGANGKEIKDIIKKVIYLDDKMNLKEMSKDEARFDYRHSIFLENEYIVIEVIMKLEKGTKDEIKAKMHSYTTKRKEKQPLEFPNAGSTFKRGEDFITAKLIDECDLKGYRIGDAEVSTKHAGFIINKGNATAKEILSLVIYVKEKVYEKFGKEIELEMQIVGEEE